MSIVDVFVEDSIRRYPSIYKSRGDVLHHVLAVLGNGFRWKDGVPYDGGFDSPGYVQPEAASLESYVASALDANYFGDEAESVDFAARQWDKDSAVLERIGEAVKDYSFSFAGPNEAASYGMSFYPEHEHAMMRNVPADIHPDWLVEVRFMREAAESYGWSFEDVV